VAFIMSWQAAGGGPEADDGTAVLAGFRRELYLSLGLRRDALFEVADAALCRPGRVLMLAELCLEPECRRGHGGVYDALNCGEVRIGRLRAALASLPLRRWDDGRIRLACDVSNWLRPDAETSPERLFCHCHARGSGNKEMIPGWPYSFVAALEPGRTSWTLPLDAVRLGPDDDPTEVTAAQLRGVAARLTAAGRWKEGDPDIMAVFDSGYDLTRLAWLLRDLPVQVTGRLRSDRVMYSPPTPAQSAACGRPARHGPEFRFRDPGTWPAPAAAAVTETTRYGNAEARSWHGLHQRLARQRQWKDHPGQLPVIEGTVIRLQVERLPGDRSPEPLWLWSSRPEASAEEAARTWQAFLRRFDIEHTFRFLKQQLGWTRPKLRDPAAADRWTWLVLACYAQLFLARHLAADIRLPWQQPCPPGRLTPARVRSGFRNLHRALPVLASPPKPSRPGPGRPPGSKNRRPATRHDVGKNTKTGKQASKDPQTDRLNSKLRRVMWVGCSSVRQVSGRVWAAILGAARRPALGARDPERGAYNSKNRAAAGRLGVLSGE
jgi:hypothetical protein